MSDPNEFEMEKHSEDGLRCIRCGASINYCHGDTDLCSACGKDNIILED